MMIVIEENEVMINGDKNLIRDNKPMTFEEVINKFKSGAEFNCKEDIYLPPSFFTNNQLR